jgi:hypothetical protein
MYRLTVRGETCCRAISRLHLRLLCAFDPLLAVPGKLLTFSNLRRMMSHGTSQNARLTSSVARKYADFLMNLAPQAGFEPATLRLTGGKRNVSRPLRRFAGHCRIVRHHSENPPIFDLRFVPPLAAVCRSLLPRKGNKRATCGRKCQTRWRRSSFGEGHIALLV